MNLLVVNNPKNWPFHVPEVPVVAARSYLTDPSYSEQRGVKVFNLCRSYRYQSAGYYVSLLAMARGHKPLPSVTTIQDMKSLAVARALTADLEDIIQHDLKPLRSDTFTLSVYFGRNLARRYDELSSRLFRLFPAPFLRADFRRDDDWWDLQNIGPIAANEIPESHRGFIIEAAKEFFAKDRIPQRRRSTTAYDMAILAAPEGEPRPSNEKALRLFIAAAKRLGIAAERIDRGDFGRLAEFDALFIRATTAVHHHTYRFARRAVAEGMTVIDDPDSIAKCSNKVYLAELLGRHKIAAPKTLVVHRDNRDAVPAEVGLPCILKQPDSSFSQGVVKVEDQAQLDQALEKLLERSDLIVAQTFMPTEFDWRIGVLDRRPLYACKYFMADKHWQIVQADETSVRYGRVEAVSLEQVPRKVLRLGVRAANLIGDGLYGVDVKQFGDDVRIIEVNDNPNIDAGYEDRIMGEALYDQIMSVFLRRIQLRRNGLARR